MSSVQCACVLGYPLRILDQLKLYLRTQSVPRSKHTPSVTKTNQSVLYSEIIAVCSQIHTKHINTLCGQNVECRTYRAVNTPRLSYKNQPVSAVQ
jgi:hypothetical protein